MADHRLNVQVVLPAGAAPTWNAGLLLADTQLVRNSGKVMLHFKKSAAVDCVITIVTPLLITGDLTVLDRIFTVPASGGEIVAGPFAPSVYNDGMQDLRFTCSDIDGVTVAVLEM